MLPSYVEGEVWVYDLLATRKALKIIYKVPLRFISALKLVSEQVAVIVLCSVELLAS